MRVYGVQRGSRRGLEVAAARAAARGCSGRALGEAAQEAARGCSGGALGEVAVGDAWWWAATPIAIGLGGPVDPDRAYSALDLAGGQAAVVLSSSGGGRSCCSGGGSTYGFPCLDHLGLRSSELGCYCSGWATYSFTGDSVASCGGSPCMQPHRLSPSCWGRGRWPG
jgi:hypothetical protein